MYVNITIMLMVFLYNKVVFVKYVYTCSGFFVVIKKYTTW